MSLFRTTLTVSAVLLLTLTGCNKAENTDLIKEKPNDAASLTVAAPSTKGALGLEVYKSPTCGCCKGWVDHMSNAGFSVNAHDMDDLQPVKRSQGIQRDTQSCHTAVSPEGFVFEGHVPAKFVKRFLAEKPAGARGLAVPAMPVGTPGMEMGNKFMPYQILLLKTDGSTQVYAMVENAEQQY